MPKGKFEYKRKEKVNEFSKYQFNYLNLSKLENELKMIDSNFKLPVVIRPYLKYCNKI